MEAHVIHFPVLRWGEPYQSLDTEKVVHFATGEELAEVSQANGGLVERDLRRAQKARDALREVPIAELIGMVRKAGDLFMSAELPLGDGSQTADDFVVQQSATTGLPEHMCRANMAKLKFVHKANAFGNGPHAIAVHLHGQGMGTIGDQ